MLAPRQWVLGLALAATVVASYLALSQPEVEEVDSDLVPMPRSVLPRADTLSAKADMAMPPTARGAYSLAATNLFTPQSWQQPTAPRQTVTAPLAPPAPLAPVVPPIPFRYLGKLLDGVEVVAFVDRGARTHLLRRGDVVADYKVTDITAQQLTLLYMPLNQIQYLPFGSSH